MAITVKIAAKVEAVELTDNTTEFVTTGPFVITGDDFGVTEKAYLMRLGPSGTFKHATNDKGRVFISAYPNTVLFEASGTFRFTKDVTIKLASVGYEEQI